MKTEKPLTLAAAGLFGLILAAGFWGFAFPRYMFTHDSVRISDEKGQDVTEEAGKDKNLYVEIGSAGADQIEIKCSILDWAKR